MVYNMIKGSIIKKTLSFGCPQYIASLIILLLLNLCSNHQYICQGHWDLSDQVYHCLNQSPDYNLYHDNNKSSVDYLLPLLQYKPDQRKFQTAFISPTIYPTHFRITPSDNFRATGTTIE